MIIDLHTHTTASDGELTPQELIGRAEQLGVDMLAITDHDSIDGLQAVIDRPSTVALVPGVELSCVWGRQLIHVVGLAIATGSPVLTAGLDSQQQARLRRAELIAEKLERYGFLGAYEYAAGLAGEGQIGRPHFARFLVECGHVNSEKQAFKKFLGAGKPCDIKLTWPALDVVVSWIRESGGIAVLAHPLHYKMTNTRLGALTADFREAGGRALEVVSGRQPDDRTRMLASLASRFELLASVGSDFHRPGMGWNELGQMGELPKSCLPVWSAWD